MIDLKRLDHHERSTKWINSLANERLLNKSQCEEIMYLIICPAHLNYLI